MTTLLMTQQLEQKVASLFITINPINDLAIATGGVVATIENTSHTFTLADFAFNDIEGNALQSVVISNLSLAGGSLTHTSGTVTVSNGDIITASELTDLTFTPDTDSLASAGFTYTVNDSDSGAVTASMTISVSPSFNGPVIVSPTNPTSGPVVDADPIEPIEELPPTVEEATPSTPDTTPIITTAPVVALAPVLQPQNPVITPNPVVSVLPEPDVAPEQPVLEEPAPPAPVVESELEFSPSIEISTPKLPDYGFTTINKQNFGENLTRVGNDVRQYNEILGSTAAKVTFTFGSLLSVGGVSFILRGGALAAALLSALPAWNRFDPISVVHGREDESEDDDDDYMSDSKMMLKFVQETQSRVIKDGSQ